MHDGVIFIDAAMRVTQWNHGAERLTGVAESTVLERLWQPSLLKIRNEKGDPLSPEDCPVTCAIRSGVQSLRRLTICGRNQLPISADSHTIPVVAGDGTSLGAIMILHDASPETSLEERCQSLHEKATKDLMTQVANRAEFDRVHETFVKHHQQEQVPCSLIICDLDRFKRVNDTFGHQAGDDAIRSLATLMKNSCRPGDLVARYGGEEFVLLAADCDNATATRRAESIRKALAHFPQPKLDGQSITASFGVTEVQPGDTAETMLRRADRALLKAKDKGRNMVIQLGTGTGSGSEDSESKSRFRKQKTATPDLVVARDLTTPAPIKVVIEKLRGFVADHQAKIVTIDRNRVEMEISDGSVPSRRWGARPVAFCVELTFSEESLEKPPSHGVKARTITRTRIHVAIQPRRKRDRRRPDAADRATKVLLSFQAYLMASIEDPESSTGVLRRVRTILGSWVSKP
jgi:diguanylate cyclase (GGDEF)-like protein